MAQPKKTPEEIAENNERTNSMGLFNTAEAFWKSAVALEKAKVKVGHAESPVRTLYYHAIELYLKALLRQHYSVDMLGKKFGHNTTRIWPAPGSEDTEFGVLMEPGAGHIA
jgi:hypothetical protein